MFLSLIMRWPLTVHWHVMHRSSHTVAPDLPSTVKVGRTSKPQHASSHDFSREKAEGLLEASSWIQTITVVSRFLSHCQSAVNNLIQPLIRFFIDKPVTWFLKVAKFTTFELYFCFSTWKMQAVQAGSGITTEDICSWSGHISGLTAGLWCGSSQLFKSFMNHLKRLETRGLFRCQYFHLMTLADDTTYLFVCFAPGLPSFSLFVPPLHQWVNEHHVPTWPAGLKLFSPRPSLFI